MKKSLGPRRVKGSPVIAHVSTERGYFSVTGEVYARDAKTLCDRTMESCGCVHDSVLEAFPHLAPIVLLHLSELDGTPMHVEANGWYWIAGALGGLGERYHGGNQEYQREDPRVIFHKHIHVGDGIADQIIDDVQCAYTQAQSEGADQEIARSLARGVWTRAVETLRPLWKDQALSALKQIEALQ